MYYHNASTGVTQVRRGAIRAQRYGRPLTAGWCAVGGAVGVTVSECESAASTQRLVQSFCDEPHWCSHVRLHARVRPCGREQAKLITTAFFYSGTLNSPGLQSDQIAELPRSSSGDSSDMPEGGVAFPSPDDDTSTLSLVRARPPKNGFMYRSSNTRHHWWKPDGL
jgi:hypothetical protein